MIHHRFPLLLILIMAIMPVAVTYASYIGMSGQLAGVVVERANDGGAADLQPTGHCQSHKGHATGCNFHVCVDCALASSFQFAAEFVPSPYSVMPIRTLLSLIVGPVIKPPIFL